MVPPRQGQLDAGFCDPNCCGCAFGAGLPLSNERHQKAHPTQIGKKARVCPEMQK